MSDAPSALPPPQAVLKPVGRPFLGWFWILPGVVLAIVCLVLVIGWAQRGERIAVFFKEGHGLKPGDALSSRGITVGEVRAVELASGRDAVKVTIDLQPSASGIAAEGSRFWIVRPRIALTGLSGLDTVVGAKYVAVLPGTGVRKRDFDGDEDAPVEPADSKGLRIVLEGGRMGGLRRGAPLTYRQKRIGSVVDARLNQDGAAVEAEVYVLPEYAGLVRENSEFWIASGFRLQGGVVSGLTLSTESAETLLAGGVAMVTFGTPGPPVNRGHRFRLADEPPRERGERIGVHFNDGHGLKPGDLLRHRGITVGEVRAVELSAGLQGVDVEIDLRPGVSGIAIEGSRFWIVRPQADLTGLSGLETVVGGKYVAVSPGAGGMQHRFVGEEDAPVQFEPGGLEIVLQGERIGGLRRGVPLTYRQVRIGSVVSARLASNAGSVDIHVYVQPAYAGLVREDSVFWNVSGLKVEFGLRSGVTVNAESAETLLAGGVAMATPSRPGKTVLPGKRFTLADEPEKDWLTWKPLIPLTVPHLPPDRPIPRLVKATLKYAVKGLIRQSTKEPRGLLLPVDGAWLLGPEDLLSVPPDAVQGKGELAFEGVGQSIPAAERRSRPLLWLEVKDPAVKEKLKESLPVNRLRRPDNTDKDYLLVGDASSEAVFVSAASLKKTDTAWEIDRSLSGDLTREKWHGAAAVSLQDGKVIGLLHIPEKKGAKVIVPFTEELLRR